MRQLTPDYSIEFMKDGFSTYFDMPAKLKDARYLVLNGARRLGLGHTKIEPWCMASLPYGDMVSVLEEGFCKLLSGNELPCELYDGLDDLPFHENDKPDSEQNWKMVEERSYLILVETGAHIPFVKKLLFKHIGSLAEDDVTWVCLSKKSCLKILASRYLNVRGVIDCRIRGRTSKYGPAVKKDIERILAGDGVRHIHFYAWNKPGRHEELVEEVISYIRGR